MPKAKSVKKVAKKATDKPKDICFIIMPFGGYFDSYYREIFIPAIADAGLIPKRGDDLFRTGTIINDVWEFTKKAKLVLADLSTKNANVFYELGLAHAIKKPAILISHSMEDVPFDLRGLRVVPYDKNVANWGEILKENITKAINETVISPVTSVLPTFLNDTDIGKTEIKITEKDFLNLQNDIEQVKRSIQNRDYSANSPKYSQEFTDGIGREYAQRTISSAFSNYMKENKLTVTNVRDDKNHLNKIWENIESTPYFKSLNDRQFRLLKDVFVEYIARFIDI